MDDGRVDGKPALIANLRFRAWQLTYRLFGRTPLWPKLGFIVRGY
jgi:hypothetical protein